MSRLIFWLTHPDVIGWNLQPVQVQKIKQALPGVEIIVCRDKEAFLAALPQAEIAVSWHFRPEWFSQANRLKILATPAAGKDYLPRQAPANVRLEFSSFHGEIIAETVVGMLLCQARGIIKAFSLQTTEAWPRRELAGFMRTLRGSRVTIWGFGHIGQWIGKLVKPFGAKIYAVKQTLIPPPPYFEAEDRIIAGGEIDSLLPETDHLVLSLPGEGTTDMLLGASRLGLLPAHAAVYNIGRGNVIDETALRQALEDRKLAAAYLDVFQEEPLPLTSPLRTCPHCYLMPHASAIAPHYLDLFLDEFLTKCKNWLTEGENNESKR